MRPRTAIVLSLLLTFGMVGAAAATDLDGLRLQQRSALVQLDLGAANPAAITSDNVEYIGTIPLDSPGVGGEPVVRADLGGRRFFYATGGKGLSVFDVTDPAAPSLTGFLPFPHLQNEDLKVSSDGTRAMIAADGGLLLPVLPATTGIHIVDLTDPSAPAIIGSSSPLVRGSGAGLGASEHTAECADAACTVIYGRSGRIYDASELPLVRDTSARWNINAAGESISTTGIHALNRDEAGIVISDSVPRLVLDPRDDPFAPVVLAEGTRAVPEDNRLQHNNVRPDALAWEPRDDTDPADAVQTVALDPTRDLPANSIQITEQRPVMRAGELLLGNSELNLNRNCNAAGGLSTWSMVNFDQGEELQQLEVFRPLNGTLVDGSPPANPGLGCSGHWFTEEDGLVAASWFEHGVRIFDIDKTVGTITEIGFFQPVVTQAGAAYWVDDEYVYNVDYARGIDIIRVDRDADRPSQEQLDASWLANAGTVGALATAERLWCGLSYES